MKKMMWAMAVALAFGGVAHAQTTAAVKESGKAIAEKAKEGKEDVQAAVTKEPSKSMHKAKAKMHKHKSAMHDTAAKAAGDQIGK